MIVCISRGSYSCGKEFAESLAEKLGCRCLGREELVERATNAGVAVGKLELACLKPHGMTERMIVEREHYQAFATQVLAELALEGPIVYHGRSAHLLLKRVSHILKLRVIADEPTRIRSVEDRLGLDREKAKRYIQQVHDDQRRWVRIFHNADWDADLDYDFIINVEGCAISNVAAAFCSVAQLPDFRETPATRRTLENLLLESRCRVALANDDRTYRASFRVHADQGDVTVSHRPHHTDLTDAVRDVVGQVPGVDHVTLTAAGTRILWLQERFDAGTQSFRDLLELATRWEAAIDLLQFRSGSVDTIIERHAEEEAGVLPSQRADAGGIEDESTRRTEQQQQEEAAEEKGLGEETWTELIKAGRAGGRAVVHGSARAVLEAVDTTATYSLVVVGDAFLDKDKAARIRLTRELGNTLRDRLSVPVIQTEEMSKEYLFGSRQLLSMLGFMAIGLLIYLAVFTNQESVLEFLSREGTLARVLAAAGVAALVPVVAHTYGKFIGNLFKLIGME